MSDTNTNEVDGLSKDFYHTREQEQKDESQLTVDQAGNWQYPTLRQQQALWKSNCRPRQGASIQLKGFHMRDFGGMGSFKNRKLHEHGLLEEAKPTSSAQALRGSSKRCSV